jgi:DNA damage-binding protein 1
MRRGRRRGSEKGEAVTRTRVSFGPGVESWRKRGAPECSTCFCSYVPRWCQVDEISNKFVIGDAYGRLALVSLASYETNGLVLVPLGEVSGNLFCANAVFTIVQASPPTCLTYLTNQVMYLGSHFGDSQLLRVESMAVSFQEFPTLPISPDIQVIRESDMFSSTKGKGREISDTNAKGGSLLALQGKHLTVLETFKNIAPIRDAITVDPDGSKQVSER